MLVWYLVAVLKKFSKNPFSISLIAAIVFPARLVKITPCLNPDKVPTIF